jgi:pyruvate carboxylase
MSGRWPAKSQSSNVRDIDAYWSNVESCYRTFGDTSIKGCCEPNEY